MGNHLLLALRRLAAKPGDAAITIGGLALGLAGCLLMLGYVRFERGYDAWQPDHERVFQIQSTIRPPGQPAVHLQGSSWPIYGRIAADFPQIEAVTSIRMGKSVTRVGGRPRFVEVTIADPEVFRVLKLPFLHGSAAAALPDATAMVMTESEARRWFGTADAMGRVLRLGAGEGERPYRVTGVLRDLPRDTSLKMATVLRRDVAAEAQDGATFGWGNFDAQHFVRLRRGADAAAIEAALPGWERRWLAKMASVVDFHLQPITAIHLGEAQDKALVAGGDARSLATFAVVAALTLAMAIINFVNLGTAHAIARTREVALRRLLGATRGRLAAGFMAETMLVAGAATLLALATVELASPAIGRLLGADLPRTYLGQRGLLLPAAGLFVLVGALGGIWPVLVLSRTNPARALAANRGSSETPGSGRARRVLVVVQFAVAIGLIASTAVIFAQTRFVAAVDPGYRRGGLIQVNNAWRFTQGSEYDAARPLLLRVDGVIGVGRTALGLDPVDRSQRLIRLADGAGHASMGVYAVDAELLPTAGVPLLAGRWLGDRMARDRADGQSAAALAARGLNILVNRAAAAKLGYRRPADAIGRTIGVTIPGDDGQPIAPATIAGVVGNTRLRTVREAAEPLIYLYDRGATDTVLVRYAGARPTAVMAGLEQVWRRFEPAIPFEARFAEDIAAAAIAGERGRAVLFAGFSALAVLIACLGLYGLAAFTAERRVREIGIRKALGARVRDIVRLLAWEFAKPVLLANLLAWPLAWWAMRDWLNGFDARVALTPVPFVLAGLLALAVALATVAGHAIRAARTNPVHALRYE